MAANAGSKIFREFFRDSPCRMAYLLKSNETFGQITPTNKVRERPKTAPNVLLKRASVSDATRFDQREKAFPPSSSSNRSSTPPVAKHIKKQNTSTVRDDPSRKHRATTSIGGTDNSKTTVNRAPQPGSRKPGGCRVCLPNGQPGLLLNEIDQNRDRALNHSGSICGRQAVALAQDIRNRVDAIVVPAGQSNVREARVTFVGGRVQSFENLPEVIRRPAEDLAVLLAQRERKIAERKLLPSPLGSWFSRGAEQPEILSQNKL